MTDNHQTQTQQYIFNTYARYPITLIKGDGAYLWDNNGKKYLDFLSGIACTPLGHAHPAITQAIIEQATQLLHTSNLYYSPPSAALAKLLVEQGALDKIFFCNSGAEANEAAIKLARKYHWRLNAAHKNIILSVDHSFHGRTLGALAATAKPKLQEGFAPLPAGFQHQSWNNISQFCQAINENTAAVIIEPVQGEGGIHVASREFLRAVREKCDQTGALFIFDEVQCGMGRSGELFAWQHFQVKPDLITLAKGIANGLPLGVLCAREQVAAAFVPGDHGTTFGANPVCAAAALATLQTLINDNYPAQVRQLSDYLFTQLHQLQQQFPQQISAIRGLGLMIGIEVKQHAADILTYCRAAGLLINVTADNVVRLLPPYVISIADIDFAVTVLREAVGKSL